MRAIATGIVCVLAAFGAAFLVTRAVDHGTAARAATGTRLPALPTETVPAVGDPKLAAQFAPERVSLRKPPPKPKPKPHHVASPSPSVPAAPQNPVSPPPTYTPAPVQTTPQTYYAPPATPSAPAPTTTTTTRHRSSSGSGSGSGTTVIGG